MLWDVVSRGTSRAVQSRARHCPERYNIWVPASLKKKPCSEHVACGEAEDEAAGLCADRAITRIATLLGACFKGWGDRTIAHSRDHRWGKPCVFDETKNLVLVQLRRSFVLQDCGIGSRVFLTSISAGAHLAKHYSLSIVHQL